MVGRGFRDFEMEDNDITHLQELSLVLARQFPNQRRHALLHELGNRVDGRHVREDGRRLARAVPVTVADDGPRADAGDGAERGAVPVLRRDGLEQGLQVRVAGRVQLRHDHDVVDGLERRHGLLVFERRDSGASSTFYIGQDAAWDCVSEIQNGRVGDECELTH